MASLLKWIHIITSVLIISKSTQRGSLAMAKEEDIIVLKHWIIDEISSLLFVEETGHNQSLRLCHCHSLAFYYHSQTHIEAFSHIVSTTVCAYILISLGQHFNRKFLLRSLSLMTSRSWILFWSVNVAFGTPIYVALTKSSSAVKRVCQLSGLGWVIEFNG